MEKVYENKNLKGRQDAGLMGQRESLYEYNFFEHIMHDFRIEEIKDLPITENTIFCLSGSGMPGVTKYDEGKC